MLSGVLYVCAQKQSDKNHKCTTNYGSVTTLSAAFNRVLREPDWP